MTTISHHNRLGVCFGFGAAQRQPVRHLQLQDIIQFELTCFNSSQCHRRSFTWSRWPPAPLLAILACCCLPPSIPAQLAQAASSPAGQGLPQRWTAADFPSAQAQSPPPAPSSICSHLALVSAQHHSHFFSNCFSCSPTLRVLVQSHKDAPLQISIDCLSSPAALPPCFVDSLFVFTCSVKDSPTSVFWLHHLSIWVNPTWFVFFLWGIFNPLFFLVFVGIWKARGAQSHQEGLQALYLLDNKRTDKTSFSQNTCHHLWP